MQKDNNGTKREVTDPITHLPVQIHDLTSVDLESIPPLNQQHDQPPSQSQPRDEHHAETNDNRHMRIHSRLLDETSNGRWNDPGDERSRMMVHAGIVAGVSSFVTAILTTSFMGKIDSFFSTKYFAERRGFVSLCLKFGLHVVSLLCQTMGYLILAIAVTSITTVVVQRKKAFNSSRREPTEDSSSRNKESTEVRPNGNEDKDHTTWLNAVLVSLWPIIHPALFTPLADILEDSLQSSLPKFVKAIKIDDISQGTDPVRVSDIRWLDVKRGNERAKEAPRGRDIQGLDEAEKEEAGEYVCLELGLIYRAPLDSQGSPRTATASPESRVHNPHLVLHLWTVAGLQVPFYISLHGLLSTARLRVALTPNPPFTGMCTLTLLGVPHVSFSLTPLSRHLPNVMDVPVLSKWVQDAINAALTEYVAPRSVSLDLGLMLGGGEKMDVEAAGVVIVTVGSARGFRDGDAMKIWHHLNKNGAARKGDAYVTVGWSKWGKPLWSTRIIQDEDNPTWNESTFLVVSSAELNSHELLRLQLWDADRMSADDNLGNIEVDLRELMNNEKSLRRISQREDPLAELDGKSCPGTLTWEVGYFPKLGLGPWVSTMAKQHVRDANNNSKSDLHVSDGLEREVEQAGGGAQPTEDEDVERRILEKDEGSAHLKDDADGIIPSLPPSPDYPSGILSIRVEQIDGLEVEKVRASGDAAIRSVDGEEETGEEGGRGDDKVPSAYCVIIINHERVYKTRTKMVTGKPYFDAGTERFIKDWQRTSVMISVRDSRLHEIDPLLGVVDLPLTSIFKRGSHITESFPLAGGIGYGRVRIAATFRSVEATLPREMLGWDTGTLEVMPRAEWGGPSRDELSSCRLVMRTEYGKAKFIAHDGTEDVNFWAAKTGRSAKLAICKRYSSCLAIQFRRSVLGPDATPAFCVFWLKDIPDNEEVEVTLPIVRNLPSGSFKRAQSNAAGDIGEIIDGTSLKLRVRFWPGLSGYHQKLQKKNKGIADVAEVLDCAEEIQGVASNNTMSDGELSDSGISSSSSSSEDYDHSAGSDQNGAENVDDGRRGVVDQLKDFQKRKGHLHRKHRGLMQWSGVRKLKWGVKTVEEKAGVLKDTVKDRVVHRQKETKMEKEV